MLFSNGVEVLLTAWRALTRLSVAMYTAAVKINQSQVAQSL